MTGREFLTLNLVDRRAPSADLDENTGIPWTGASGDALFAVPCEHARPKRLRWLCLSLTLQALVVGFLVFRSVTAESELPAPRVVKTFLTVAPMAAPPPPPPAIAVATSSSRVKGRRPVVAPPMRFAAIVASTIPIEMGDFTGAGFDEGVAGGVPGGVIGGLVGGLGEIPARSVPEPEPTIYVVSGELKRPEKLVHVDPVYPPIATAARVEGLVILEATIDGEGNVGNLRVLRSIPLLDGAALEAVKCWKYAPTIIGSKPVPILMTVTVKFALA